MVNIKRRYNIILILLGFYSQFCRNVYKIVFKRRTGIIFKKYNRAKEYKSDDTIRKTFDL